MVYRILIHHSLSLLKKKNENDEAHFLDALKKATWFSLLYVIIDAGLLRSSIGMETLALILSVILKGVLFCIHEIMSNLVKLEFLAHNSLDGKYLSLIFYFEIYFDEINFGS